MSPGPSRTTRPSPLFYSDSLSHRSAPVARLPLLHSAFVSPKGLGSSRISSHVGPEGCRVRWTRSPGTRFREVSVIREGSKKVVWFFREVYVPLGETFAEGMTT